MLKNGELVPCLDLKKFYLSIYLLIEINNI